MSKKNLIIILIGLGALVAGFFSVINTPIIYEAEDHDEVDHQDVDSQEISLVTLNATDISTMFTTLNGELVDMGNYSSVEVYFVWGENPGEYTKETPKQIMTSPGMFSAEISDIFEPDTTYYFQARSNPEGSSEEVSFYVY